MSLDWDKSRALAGSDPEESDVRAPRPPLVSLLAERGVAGELELREAAEEARREGLRFGDVVVARGWLDEEGLSRVVAEQWRLPFLDREALALDPVAAGLLPVEQARELGGCVIAFRDGGPLVVVAEPTHARLTRLRQHLSATSAAGTEASFAVASPAALEGLLNQLGRMHRSTDATAPDDREPAQADAPADHEPPQGSADAETALVKVLLADLEQASDGLATLHERVERLGAVGRASEQQAAQLRRERDGAVQEAARQQDRVRELEQALEQERLREQAFLQRLADLLAEFRR